MFDFNPFLLSGAISLAIQSLFFIFAASFKTDKLTDLAYGLTFIVLVLSWLIINNAQNTWYHYLLAGAVLAWSLRLTGYLFWRISKMKKDDRFDDKRNNVGELAKFWLLQAISIPIIALPVIYLLNQPATSVADPFVIAGFILYLVGLIIETKADAELYRFVFIENKNRRDKKWCNQGLWRLSRHPNYFGEIVLWLGIFITGLSFYQGLGWLVIIGPIYLILLLRYVSGVPLIEKKHNQRWGHLAQYQRYKKATNLIIVFPKLKKKSRVKINKHRFIIESCYN